MSLVLSTDTALAACAGGHARILANQTIDRVMTVRGGKSCAIRLSGSSGPTFGAEIMERPQHGTVAVQVPHRVVYTARAGYVGDDSFTYARKGLSTRNAPVTFAVGVAVRVRP
jgi:hypothetical protein